MARSGSEYRSITPYYYEAGRTYYFRFDVDLTTHTYSVWLKLYSYADYYAQIAENFQFRTEQLSVTRLDNVASFVNPETSPSTSSVEVCGVNAVMDDSTADGCLHSMAGSGFANMVLPVTSGGPSPLRA